MSNISFGHQTKGYYQQKATSSFLFLAASLLDEVVGSACLKHSNGGLNQLFADVCSL